MSGSWLSTGAQIVSDCGGLSQFQPDRLPALCAKHLPRLLKLVRSTYRCRSDPNMAPECGPSVKAERIPRAASGERAVSEAWIAESDPYHSNMRPFPYTAANLPPQTPGSAEGKGETRGIRRMMLSMTDCLVCSHVWGRDRPITMHGRRQSDLPAPPQLRSKSGAQGSDWTVDIVMDRHEVERMIHRGCYVW